MALTTQCPDLEELAAYLDGTSLSAEERARVTEHLASCESCYEIFAGAARYLEDESPAAKEAATADTEVRPVAEDAVTTDTKVRPAADPPPTGAQDKPEDQRAEGAEQNASDPPRPGGPARPFVQEPRDPTRRRTARRGRFVLPGGRALPVRSVSIALAALLALAIGWAVLRRLSQPQPVQAMALLLAPSDEAARAVPWSKPMRGVNVEEVPFVHESFRFGVRQFDLELALAAPGRANLGAAADRMCTFLSTTPELTTPAITDACARIRGRRPDETPGQVSGTPSGREAAQARAKADSAASRKDAGALLDPKELSEAFEPAIVELGSWAEACRLCAVATGGDAQDLKPAPETQGVLDFLRGDTTRRLLADSLASHSGTDRSDLDDGRDDLLQIQQGIGKLPAAPGPGVANAMAEVGNACIKLLQAYDAD